MPYIAIKAFPRDLAAKKEIVEKINELFLTVWNCPQEAISISVEDVAPAAWEESVRKSEIEPQMENMMILSGEKRYK